MSDEKTSEKKGGVNTTYTQSVKNISAEVDVSTTLVGKVLKAFGKEMCRVLVDEGHFRWASFGSFNVKTLPPRKARNPQTNETIQVGERKKVRFKAGSGVVSQVCGVDASAVAPTETAAPKPTASEDPGSEDVGSEDVGSEQVV